LLLGHQFGPGRLSQLHGNWVVGWPRLSEDTGAGGAHSISCGFDTHHPDPLLQARGLKPGTPGPAVLAQSTRKFACSRAIRLGPADRHSYRATDLFGGHDCRKTPVLGGSFHQFWLTPTIRTHCSRQWGQHPELLGHQLWSRRPGRWHCAKGRSRWTPTDWVTSGQSRMEGAPCEGTRHVRGSFYGTLTCGHTLGWPQLSGAQFTGHSAMGPYSKWRVINTVCQLNKVGRRH
jgi:hypothetical protein